MKKLKYYAGGKRHAEQDEAFLASLSKDKWVSGDAEKWDTCWYTGMPKPSYFKELSDRQNINHIPGNNSLTIKSYLHNTLSSAQNRQLDNARKDRYWFFPGIYDMPGDYHKYQEFVASNPDDNWILKPKNSSRGRGIEVVTDTLAVPSTQRWMVQQYLSNPDLIQNRKYVFRLYVLITSIDPLQVYLYEEGLVKLASEPFSLDNLDNPFAHLTNPDINATNSAVEAPVVFYSLEHYRELLKDRGQDADKLFQQIRDLVTLTVIASREKFRSRIESAKINQHACYELLGLDCMIDADLKPWILECNLSPSLETCTTQGEEADIETVIKTNMVKDMVGLRALNDVENRPAPSDFDTKADFIKANLAYETAHSGGFERMYPATDTVQDYAEFFVPLKSDLIAAEAVNSEFTPPEKYAHAMTPHLVTENNTLAIYDSQQQKFIELSAHESWVWVKLMTGDSLLQTHQDFLDNFTQNDSAIDTETLEGLEAFAWDCAARWTEKGYCNFHAAADREKAHAALSDSPSLSDLTPSHLTLDFKGKRLRIECFDAGLADIVKTAYAGHHLPETDKNASADDLTIDLVRGLGGYHAVQGGRISNRMTKDKVIDELNARVLQSALGGDFNVALRANVLAGSDAKITHIIMNSSPKVFEEYATSTGLLVNFQTNAFETAALPAPYTSENSTKSTSRETMPALAKDLRFSEYSEKKGELISITDPVKIMNWVVENGISNTGVLTTDEINHLVEIMQ